MYNFHFCRGKCSYPPVANALVHSTCKEVSSKMENK